jgi:hypothetical protein
MYKNLCGEESLYSFCIDSIEDNEELVDNEGESSLSCSIKLSFKVKAQKLLLLLMLLCLQSPHKFMKVPLEGSSS